MVVCHSDPQQGNILIKNDDASKIVMIDYEETSFGPRSWDLASYLATIPREISHPGEPGAKFYPENTITESELLDYTHYFLTEEFWHIKI